MQVERRKEERHDVPDPCRQYITCTVKKGRDQARAVIGNFSRNGILFECPLRFSTGDHAECSLSVTTSVVREVTFGIDVRYCYDNKGSFITGASVNAISEDKWFDAFEKLFDMIVTRQECGGNAL